MEGRKQQPPGKQTSHKQKTRRDSEAKMGSLSRGPLPSGGGAFGFLSGRGNLLYFNSESEKKQTERRREDSQAIPSPGQQTQKAIPAQSLEEETGVWRQKARD